MIFSHNLKQSYFLIIFDTKNLDKFKLYFLIQIMQDHFSHSLNGITNISNRWQLHGLHKV